MKNYTTTLLSQMKIKYIFHIFTIVPVCNWTCPTDAVSRERNIKKIKLITDIKMYSLNVVLLT